MLSWILPLPVLSIENADNTRQSSAEIESGEDGAPNAHRMHADRLVAEVISYRRGPKAARSAPLRASTE